MQTKVKTYTSWRALNVHSLLLEIFPTSHSYGPLKTAGQGAGPTAPPSPLIPAWTAAQARKDIMETRGKRRSCLSFIVSTYAVRRWAKAAKQLRPAMIRANWTVLRPSRHLGRTFASASWVWRRNRTPSRRVEHLHAPCNQSPSIQWISRPVSRRPWNIHTSAK